MFSDFVERLDRSRPRVGLPVLLAGGLLVGWTVWFFLARVAVYELSREARLEVNAAPHFVDAPVSGRVIAVKGALGRTVSAGEILVELDSAPLHLDLIAARERADSLAPQIAALRRELAERGRGASFDAAIVTVEKAEAEALTKAEEATAKLSADESSQIEELRRRKYVADVESLRYAAAAARQKAQLGAQRIAVERIGRLQRLRLSERRASVAHVESEIASLEAEQSMARARIRSIEHDVDLRTIRAPVAGRIGAMETLRPGTVVKEGTRIATIVPEGNLRLVAWFDPSAAVGRVRRGQPAHLRLDGFPWTKFGAVGATVDDVGSEAAEGLVRVELHVDDGAHKLPIPVQHGLPGLVEVEVDRASPASLVLDAAGRFLDRSDERRAAWVSQQK